MKEQGKLNEAINQFNNILKIYPDNAEAHNNLGNALKDQGKFEIAIREASNE